MPTKWLPDSAHIDQLKHQAKDLLRDFRDGQMTAFQRVREFHPRFSKVADSQMSYHSFKLSDAQLSIAREYGYRSWPRLKAVITEKLYEELRLSQRDRLPDGLFKQALDFMDAGDEARLKQLLRHDPELIHERVSFEGGNYFRNPTLLEFLPQNPIRQERLPANAIAIAKILLAAGAKHNRPAMNETLMLAASGSLCRECGLQTPLLRLLCAHGADPAAGMRSALAHGEFEAARTLIECGAPIDLPTAATLGEQELVRRLVKGADAEQLQWALSLAANTKQAEIVKTLILAGAAPNLYNPPGGHSHCTPLHSAVASNQFQTVVAIVEGGADLSMKDVHHGMTPLAWAEYLKHEKIADFLKSQL